MIREEDLNQAITECMAESDPNAWTCIRMASFYIIRQQLFGKPEHLPPDYATLPMFGASYASAPPEPDDTIRYTGKSAFAKAIDGKRAADIWPIMDELMSILQTLYPEIYERVLSII